MLFWASLALEAALILWMVRGRRYRELPVFFSYLVLLVARSAVFFAVRRWGGDLPYFYTYWAAEVLCWAWSLAAIQELMQRLFATYTAVRRLVLVAFRWGAALLIAFVLITAYVAPGTDGVRAMQGVLMLERSVRVVQVGLLSLLFVFAGFLRLRWPQHVFGVAVGFAIFTTVELAAVTMRTHGGIALHNSFALLKPLAFVVAQLVWVSYFALPEPARERGPRAIPELSGWDAALAELLRR